MNQYPGYTPLALLNVAEEINRFDSRYKSCHVFGHELAQLVIASEPDAWREVFIGKEAWHICFGGYFHGMLQARFEPILVPRDAEIVQITKDACAYTDNALVRSMCAHGQGHALWVAVRGDVPRALSFCAIVTHNEQEKNACVQGVFMQFYRPSTVVEEQMHSLRGDRPSPKSIALSCKNFGSIERKHCLVESWALFESSVSSSSIESFCSLVDTPNAPYCFSRVAELLGSRGQGGASYTKDICDLFPTSRHSLCVSTLARSLLFESEQGARQALTFCSHFDASTRSQCIERIRSGCELLIPLSSMGYKQVCHEAGFAQN
ncbi:hypothetical protein EBR66_06665 [bacterium]|nr:hypothetical protein [bacterium]